MFKAIDCHLHNQVFKHYKQYWAKIDPLLQKKSGIINRHIRAIR